MTELPCSIGADLDKAVKAAKAAFPSWKELGMYAFVPWDFIFILHHYVLLRKKSMKASL
ncbi:MAG: hypothetical protein ACXVB0_11790 [Mucilaginibacter sp.]